MYGFLCVSVHPMESQLRKVTIITAISVCIYFQFLLIFRKAKAGELESCSGLQDLYSQLQEVNVDEVGVGGASKFFEAKVSQPVVTVLTHSVRFSMVIDC